MTDVIEHQKSHRSKDTNATMASDNSETCPPSRVVFAVKMKISAFLLTACVSIVGVEAYLPSEFYWLASSTSLTDILFHLFVSRRSIFDYLCLRRFLNSNWPKGGKACS